MNLTAKSPAVWIPVTMSLVALGIVLVHVALFGIVHEADEGTPAHLFQLLMVGQVPVVIFMLIKWFPRMPRQAMLAMTVQIAAALAACAAVFFLT
jgi:hypothetical protein